ncbi:hypothetical protein ABIF65_003755 [Bradyrhizobium japonicum]|jgi:hypothetical protein|uniref:hypothetical protein n=1 Tax=Bradyrhizobium TaxID=374 RepID=UPI0004BA8493|nr:MULTISPECIES: hypothetical protein [Bradyrhizobium]MBR0879504.1 hypothetical protein [Bradyrhizobium liaoningense]MBR0998762.1 hypothetical protein [Bradyrhizobium liaoningense]MBR1030043.1 hypothetical protein [Bradyrhizobium liaoningense]MBR1066901.1 hypothetical protein [Bradyrhizobium liaoningense]MDI2075528.1 hypothetical protein [Bradyrhizobium sp. Mp27]
MTDAPQTEPLVPQSHSDVIDAFGGPVKFGTAVGIKDSHARTMKARDSIPSGRWTDVVAAADREGIAHITLQLLADLDAAKLKTKAAESEGAS